MSEYEPKHEFEIEYDDNEEPTIYIYGTLGRLALRRVGVDGEVETEANTFAQEENFYDYITHRLANGAWLIMPKATTDPEYFEDLVLQLDIYDFDHHHTQKPSDQDRLLIDAIVSSEVSEGEIDRLIDFYKQEHPEES